MAEFDHDSVPSSDPVVGGAAAESAPLTPELIDVQVLAMSKTDLESLVKTYFKALNTIAEVECKEGDKWCYEDAAIECEHNVARKALGEF